MTLSAARVLTPPLQRFPIGLRAANKLVVDLHRHLDVATTGHKFSVSVGFDRKHRVGVAIVYDIHDQPHEERVWLVSAREIEQYSNREGEGDEGGYASIERVVEFGHHDLENACSYVLTELEVTL